MSIDNLYRRIESSGVNGVPKAQLKKEFDITSDQLFDGLLSKGVIFEEKKERKITYWSKDNYVQYLVGDDPKFKLIFDLNSKANNTILDTISKINSELNNKVATVTEELNNKVATVTEELNNKVATVTEELNNKVATVTEELNNKVATVTEELNNKVNSDTISKINSELNNKVATVTEELNNIVNRTLTDVRKTVEQTPKTKGNWDNGNTNLTLDKFKMEFDRTLTDIPTSIGWVEMAMIRERICDKYTISTQNFYTLASQLFDQFNNGYELSSGGNEGVTVRGLLHGFVRCI